MEQIGQSLRNGYHEKIHRFHFLVSSQSSDLTQSRSDFQDDKNHMDFQLRMKLCIGFVILRLLLWSNCSEDAQRREESIGLSFFLSSSELMALLRLPALPGFVE